MVSSASAGRHRSGELRRARGAESAVEVPALEKK